MNKYICIYIYIPVHGVHRLEMRAFAGSWPASIAAKGN